MFVQTEPILLFRHSDRTCYINIIEHTPAKTIMSTCTFLYYHKQIVHATLVTTTHFFYLINIHDELKITCGKYIWERVRHSHSVSIIKCAMLVIASYNLLKYNLFGVTTTVAPMVTSSFTTHSTLLLNGYITRKLCHTTRKWAHFIFA